MGHGETTLAVVILAAGQGTRMKSERAKVLHDLGGRPLLGWPLAAAEALAPERLVVVIGRDAERVEAAFAGRASFVVQREQRGTGHAVQQAEPVAARLRRRRAVLYGDVPLLRERDAARLRARKAETGADLVMLTSPEPLPGPRRARSRRPRAAHRRGHRRDARGAADPGGQHRCLPARRRAALEGPRPARRPQPAGRALSDRRRRARGRRGPPRRGACASTTPRSASA